MEAIKNLDLLGLRAVDAVTNFSGVITSISFDLYGCVQAVVTPPVDKKTGEAQTGNWFDIARLKITDDTPVIKRPNFDLGYIAKGKKGAAEKPDF